MLTFFTILFIAATALSGLLILSLMFLARVSDERIDFLRSGAVAAQQPHKLCVAGSIPASATNS